MTRKQRRALGRRRAAGGFTLFELMVVVLLISILAALAAPSMTEARNDRIAFDYARQYQQVLVQARSRAAGTGAAHLALLRTYNGAPRGWIRLYAALDGEPQPPNNLVGPNPIASCKNLNQWVDGAADPIVVNSTTARFIDKVDLTRAGVNDDMDIRANLFAGDGVVGSASAPTQYIAICVTPSGVTYVGAAATAALSIASMRSATAFTGVAEVDVQRYKSGTAVGLKRRVLITGGGVPRLRSE